MEKKSVVYFCATLLTGAVNASGEEVWILGTTPPVLLRITVCLILSYSPLNFVMRPSTLWVLTVRPSVSLSLRLSRVVCPASKTKRRRKAKLGVNVPQDGVASAPNFQLIFCAVYSLADGRITCRPRPVSRLSYVLVDILFDFRVLILLFTLCVLFVCLHLC